jgi:Mrp family chromosome partitioning ATPase
VRPPFRVADCLDLWPSDGTAATRQALQSNFDKVTDLVPYDFIIVDFPPLILSDANSLAGSLQRFVLVAEWQKTPARLIADAMKTAPLIAEKLVGVVLNKIDVAKMQITPTGFKSSWTGPYFTE